MPLQIAKSRAPKVGLFVLVVCTAPSLAVAGSVMYSQTNGARSSSALFERSGSNLVITLTNTSIADALVPTDILTSIFFELSGDPALTPISAVLPAASSVFVGGSGVDVTPIDRVVGGEWAYRNGIAGMAPYNGGISSSGLDLFGPHDVFPGVNLQGPASPGGNQYGITSAGDNLLTGNGGLTGRDFIKNSVVFTLGGFDAEPDAAVLSVLFQYGTSLDEPSFDGNVPEPGTLALGVIAALAFVAYRMGRPHVRR
jgi:hypothetical protein